MNQLWRWCTRWLRRFALPRYVLELQDRSSRWKKLRATHLQKEPVCQACGRVRDLEVHHIVPVSVDPDRELDPRNLITLCGSPCHIVFGHFMNYHCYNREVRKTVAAYRAAMQTRKCSK